MPAFHEAARAAIDLAQDREALIAAVVELLAGERRRCAQVCRERAALWRRTPAATAEAPYAREEARARANEATYLADLIESGEG